MKILSFQPCSLYQNGGMGRLLRRLYQGHEVDIIGLYITNGNSKHKQGEIREIAIPAFPVIKPWMRWKARNFFMWMQDSLFYPYTKSKIKRAVVKTSFDVLHIVNHGAYSTVLCNDDFLKNKQLWTSFHDHFSLCSSFEDTHQLWNCSDRRLVISSELGEEYQRIFGKKDFEIITDGVSSEEISEPKKKAKEQISIYFSGLMHIEYYPLLQVLADSLDDLIGMDYSFKLILRGTQELNFLKARKFEIEYRSDFISDYQIKEELDRADILYLPIKFSMPNFYLYSLSTKMISYLGAAGSILYHGPSDSAACKFLKKNNAAFCCVSLLKNDMIDQLKEIASTDGMKCLNAKKIAKSNFDLHYIQNSFWNK